MWLHVASTRRSRTFRRLRAGGAQRSRSARAISVTARITDFHVAQTRPALVAVAVFCQPETHTHIRPVTAVIPPRIDSPGPHGVVRITSLKSIAHFFDELAPPVARRAGQRLCATSGAGIDSKIDDALRRTRDRHPLRDPQRNCPCAASRPTAPSARVHGEPGRRSGRSTVARSRPSRSNWYSARVLLQRHRRDPTHSQEWMLSDLAPAGHIPDGRSRVIQRHCLHMACPDYRRVRPNG